MKLKYLWILATAFLIVGCDDNTDSLGSSVIPDDDLIPNGSKTYNLISRSIPSDSVYARTSIAFLGRYTDTNFGTFTADFLTQFNCTDNLEIPTKRIYEADPNIRADMQFFYTQKGYFGAPRNPNNLSVYKLSTEIEDDPNIYYYTSIDPSKYAETTPLTRKTYSIIDPAISDSVWNLSDTEPEITIPFPNNSGMNDNGVEKGVGQFIIDKYNESPGFFANSDVFAENVFKGVYVKTDHGDGSVLYIDRVILRVIANIHAVDTLGNFLKREEEGHVGEDSILYNRVIARFANTKEVIQANRFQNTDMQNWIDEHQEQTYIKSPAGIFTEIDLPMSSISDDLEKDTLNSVKITFPTYKKINSNDTQENEMPVPSEILMLRKKDMYSFFEKNQLPDRITSYITSHDSSNNHYAFNNIRRLIATCLNEYQEAKESGIELEEDWNKIVLIPITKILDSSGNIIAIRHDLKLNSVRLVRGKDSYEEGSNERKLEMNIVYTRFQK